MSLDIKENFQRKFLFTFVEKLKGHNSNTSEKLPKGQQERKTQHRPEEKMWESIQECHLGIVLTLLDYTDFVFFS